MGGNGSGRRSYLGAKATTTDCLSLDVRRLHREGLLEPNLAFVWQWERRGQVLASIRVLTTGPNQVTLCYRHRGPGEKWKEKSYPVYLDWTSCNYGGKRPWFLCPTEECGRRVAVLYGFSQFACRQCSNLVYKCQREDTSCRLTRRADKIRDRMGWGPGILSGIGPKPKGMHWQTYARLCEEHEALVDGAIGLVMKRFNIAGNSRRDWF